MIKKYLYHGKYSLELKKTFRKTKWRPVNVSWRLIKSTRVYATAGHMLHMLLYNTYQVANFSYIFRRYREGEWRANQWTDFYMLGTSFLKELIWQALAHCFKLTHLWTIFPFCIPDFFRGKGILTRSGLNIIW